jgi:hypothetical protein
MVVGTRVEHNVRKQASARPEAGVYCSE